MAGIYGKGARAKATKLHSLYVRTRDGFTCRHCGKTRNDDVQIQCAHIISRNYGATRTDERNAVALCAKCHWRFGKWPVEFADFVETELGRELYDELSEKAMSNVGKKVDYDAEVDRLQALLEGLGNGY